MGMLMEATVPTTHRWIPKAMNVQYLAKATTSLRAFARLDPPDFDAIACAGAAQSRGRRWRTSGPVYEQVRADPVVGRHWTTRSSTHRVHSCPPDAASGRCW